MDSQMLTPISAKNFTQTIKFNGSETNSCVTIVAQDVTVNCSAGNHNHGSSKVKLKNVVDYSWEQKYYPGNLLAVHVAGKFFAYSIKGKGSGMIRVANQDSQMRALIKDMNGQVQDMAFAHIISQVILASVDEAGTLLVYNCEEKSDSIICTLLLHVVQDVAGSSNMHRVVWCPYLPEEEDCDEDGSRLLVLTHGNKAELLNVAIINSKQGVGPLSVVELNEGYLEINEHSQPIMDAAFSPDGTAVATASVDGFVKFFQIYMHEGTKPRCLHEWQPHEGKPLSCLSFLDNHNFYSSDDQFWKFAITGCNNNTELKVWSCELWTCLQTIHFVPSPASLCTDLVLKMRLDLSAGYLLLSEINNRILYVLEMHKDRSGTKAFARSISEFLLPAPFLSYSILQAVARKFRCSSSTEELDPCDEADDFDDGHSIVAAFVHMYVISPKRLQECQIVFQADSGAALGPTGRDALADGPAADPKPEAKPERSSPSDTVVSQLKELTSMLQNNLPKQHFNELQLMQPAPPLNLMTPDAFNSPAKNDTCDLELNLSPTLVNLKSPGPDGADQDADVRSFPRAHKDFASGGSSPSREVQEILSLNNSTYSGLEFYDDTQPQPDGELLLPASTAKFKESPGPDANGWPRIPILKAQEVIQTEESRLSLQDHSLSLSQKGEADLRSLEQRLGGLQAVIKEQSAQLDALSQEVKGLKVSQDRCSIPDDLENVIAKQLDLALARSHAQQTKLFDGWASARLSKDREHQEGMAAHLSHLVNKQLQTVVTMEMKQVVLPLVVNLFEGLRHALQDDFSQKMAATDQMLQDNLAKFVSSKMVADSLSSAVVDVLRPGMEACYRDVVANTLVPSWERVCTNMFQQIHDTFMQGTKEYTTSVEAYMERQRRTQEKGRELVTQMQSLSDVMRSSTEKLSCTLPAELQKQVAASLAGLQDALTAKVNDVVKEQITHAFKNHVSVIEDSVLNAVRSRAVTPLPHIVDTQVQLAHIQQLLTKGHINAAFQHALSASDLALVMYICERVNPTHIFGQTPCPLQQHVLLSLIQQLSADMTNQTDLKHKFLEEAVLNLDVTNPVTKEHMSTVLKGLNSQLNSFIAANPTSKITRNMKVLQMATQSLLKN